MGESRRLAAGLSWVTVGLDDRGWIEFGHARLDGLSLVTVGLDDRRLG